MLILFKYLNYFYYYFLVNHHVDYKVAIDLAVD